MPITTEDLRLMLKCLVIVLLVVWMLIRFARICLCDNCKDPNAIYVRGNLQLCRVCAGMYDRYMRPRYRRLLYFFRSERRDAA